MNPAVIGLKQSPEEVSYSDAKAMEIVSFVNDEFKRREDERRPFELQWRLNMAFIEGNQFLEVHPSAQELSEVPKLIWWQEREVFNHVGPIYETRISKLSKMRPVLKARPGTGDLSDIRAAKVSTHLLRNIYSEQKIQNKLQEIVGWSEACGSVFLKNTWNPHRGPIIAEIRIEDIREVLREGDLDIVVVPPQEIYPDSTFRQNIDNCQSIIHAKAFHINEIEERWGVKVSPENVNVLKMYRSRHGLGGLGYGRGGYHYITDSLKNHAIVKEYWERPSKKYPEGRLIIVAGDKLLHSGPNPYLVGENREPGLPFTKNDCIERTGIFWGRAVVERLIPIQRRYNAVRNRKAEYLNRVALGQWTVEENSVDLDVFEEQAGAPGAIHTFKRGYSRPEQVRQWPLPHAFETEHLALLQEFNQISGVSELSRQSKADPGVKSGVALSIALEQDDTRLTTTAGNIEQMLIESGKQWLRLYKQFAEAHRTLRIIGRNNVVEVIDWNKSDIQSDDVMIEPYSALAESPAQRRQMAYEFLQAGLFNDPDTGKLTREMRARVFEMIQLGNWEAGDDEEQSHIAKAERENYKITEGVMTMPVDYDDHFIHISRHNRYRLTAEYEALMVQDPSIEERFKAHVDIHAAMIQQVAMQQMMTQAAMQPGSMLTEEAEKQPPLSSPETAENMPAELPIAEGGGPGM